MKFARIMASAVCVCAFSSLGWAQSYENPDEAQSFKFTIGVAAEATDNRDSTEEAESNVDLYVSPRLSYDVNGAGESLYLFSYSPSLRYRTSPSDTEENTDVFHDLNVNLTHDLITTRLKLNEHFNITDDPAVTKNGLAINRDSSFTYNSIELGVDHDLSNGRSVVGLSGRHTMKRYDDNERALDSDEDSIGGGGYLLHKVSGTLGLVLFGDAVAYSYNNFEGIDRDFDTIVGGAGVERKFTDDLRGGVRVGGQMVEYADSTLDGASGPYVKVAALAGNAPTRLDASVKYAVRNSDVFPFASQEEVEFHAKLEWETEARDLLLALSGTYRNGSYSEDTLPVGGASYQNEMGFATEGDRNALLIAASSRYRFSDNTFINLTLQHENVDAEVCEEYTRNTAMLEVKRQF